MREDKEREAVNAIIRKEGDEYDAFRALFETGDIHDN